MQQEAKRFRGKEKENEKEEGRKRFVGFKGAKLGELVACNAIGY